MNAVIIGVVLMLVLSAARLHVVLSLIIGAFVGGLAAGLPLTDSNGITGVVSHFQNGVKNGAGTALSYAVLGAFAMAITHSGLPQQLAARFTAALGRRQNAAAAFKVLLLGSLLLMGIFSQNVIPIHIAFIPMMVPPLLAVFNRLQIDRRLLACVMTFGLVTTYMFLPYGFGAIFLNDILLANIRQAGMDTGGVNIMYAMAIPALGMVAGLAAAFWHYRKPRHYADLPAAPVQQQANDMPPPSRYRSAAALAAIVACFAIQLIYDNALLLGALVGFGVFMALGVVKRRDSDSIFGAGVAMMAGIGFIMIAAQGFAEVMKATGQIQMLVDTGSAWFGGSKALAAGIMLAIGLLVTMGIGSSFSTLPIIAAVYVPLCTAMGFSPAATIALIGTAGALGDAGSPASDSTLGPTMGLNADGQHNHIRDSVLPTFLHYNIPLFIAGWLAAMVL